MNNSSAIPPFPEPLQIKTPSVDLIFNDKLYLQDSVAFSCYKPVLPLDPAEIANPDVKSIGINKLI